MFRFTVLKGWRIKNTERYYLYIDDHKKPNIVGQNLLVEERNMSSCGQLKAVDVSEGLRDILTCKYIYSNYNLNMMVNHF